MDWFVFGIQWLHVLAGVTWFGAVIYNDFILIPAFIKLPVDLQRAAGRAIGAQGQKVILPTATAAIVLGILRGTHAPRSPTDARAPSTPLSSPAPSARSASSS